MNNILSKKRTKLYIISFIISLIYIIICLKPTLVDFDENYTLSLIRHGYRNIIYFDTMDVHPPLYYLLLKLFINITTFWTSDILIKIYFARLFSVMVMIITFIFLRKITRYLHLVHNIYLQWIILIILPNVLGYNFSLQPFTDIRMYSLAAMFITMEYYYLLKFSVMDNNKYLVISIVGAICASYTHYYALLFSIMLIVVYAIKYLYDWNIKKFLKFVISEIFLCISLIPWIPSFIHQINNPATYWMSYFQEIKEIVLFLVIFGLFTIPLIILMNHFKDYRIYEQYIILSTTILVTFLFTVIYSFVRHPMFQYRYMFPILIIYEFLSINAFVNLYKSNLRNRCLIILILFLVCSLGVSIKSQITTDLYSFNSVKIYREWSNNRKGTIYLSKTFIKNHFINLNNVKNSNYNSTCTFYIMSLNKRIVMPKIYKRKIKNNMHINYNLAYKKLFHKANELILFK